MQKSTEIINLTCQKVPRVPFSKIKNEILRKEYELSLVFIGEKRSRNLNSKHRGKEEPASVLGFPLDEDAGEIFITLKEVPRKAKELKMSKINTLAYLFVHELLHLKGYHHGRKMEEQEKKFSRFLS